MGQRRLCPSSGPGREDGEMGGGWGGWGGAQRPLPNIPQWATGTTAGQPHKRSKNSETARTPGLKLNIFPMHYRFKGPLKGVITDSSTSPLILYASKYFR